MAKSPVGYVSIDGKPPISLEYAHINATNRGFSRRLPLETMLSIDSRIIDFQAHLTRLRAAAESIGIELPCRDEIIHFEAQNLIEKLNVNDCMLRVLIFRSNATKRGIHAHSQHAQRILYAMPIDGFRPAKNKLQALSLQVTPSYQLNRQTFLKSNSYLPSIQAISKAQKHGFDDILWKNLEEELTESSTSNIFLMRRDGDSLRIETPSPYSGLLCGITRARVIQLLETSGIPVTQRVIYYDELASFDEAFLTSSIKGLVPVARIDDHNLQTLRKNASFFHVSRLYQAWLQSQSEP